MKGLNFESTLTYTYSKSQEQMKNILEQDGFQKFKQNDDLKIVEYTIDHSRQIKLSQLLYLQEIRYIKLNIAQNIQLCLDIIMKYQKLKDQNIQHNYLSSDRIILNLTDQQSQIQEFNWQHRQNLYEAWLGKNDSIIVSQELLKVRI